FRIPGNRYYHSLPLRQCPEVHGMDVIKHDLLTVFGKRRFASILADPPWRFTNKSGKIAPEHRRLTRYSTMRLDEILALPVEQLAAPTAHLYLWCPNALLPEGLAVMKARRFTYKPTLVWHTVPQHAGSDGRPAASSLRTAPHPIPLRAPCPPPPT